MLLGLFCAGTACHSHCHQASLTDHGGSFKDDTMLRKGAEQVAAGCVSRNVQEVFEIHD